MDFYESERMYQRQARMGRTRSALWWQRLILNFYLYATTYRRRHNTLRLNDASISYINMLLKHSYQKWQASMLQGKK